jgi:hypothetical protein
MKAPEHERKKLRGWKHDKKEMIEAKNNEGNLTIKRTNKQNNKGVANITKVADHGRCKLRFGA